PVNTLAAADMSKAPSEMVAPFSTFTPRIDTFDAITGSSGAATGTSTESCSPGTALGNQFRGLCQSVVPWLAVQVRVTPATRMERVPLRRRPIADISEVPQSESARK